MITQSKGKIYLADERGHNETDWFRSLNLFNFGQYLCENKQAFGDLYVLNEDTLAGERSTKWLVEEDTHVILLPVVGDIEFKSGAGGAGRVGAGAVQVLCLEAGVSYEIKNPYVNELVKYVQLWIKAPAGQMPGSFQNKFHLDNYQLIDLFGNAMPEDCRYAGAVMKLNGRQEDTYRLKHPGNGIFVYILQGAMEVQYRLMHEGDGLGLWELNEIAFEALSNDAILLIIEVPFKEKS